MCSCRETAPVHLHDPETSLIKNLLGRSFAEPAEEIGRYGGMLCDCGASYLASAFAQEPVAMACIVIALGTGFLKARRMKLMLPLIGIWTVLIAGNLLRELTHSVGRIATYGPDLSARPIIDDYSFRFLASLPVQLAVDAVVLFAVPAGLAYAAGRTLGPATGRSRPLS
jgi:hypothetical protein